MAERSSAQITIIITKKDLLEHLAEQDRILLQGELKVYQDLGYRVVLLQSNLGLYCNNFGFEVGF